jgi:hypothetical protein
MVENPRLASLLALSVLLKNKTAANCRCEIVDKPPAPFAKKRLGVCQQSQRISTIRQIGLYKSFVLVVIALYDKKRNNARAILTYPATHAKMKSLNWHSWLSLLQLL